MQINKQRARKSKSEKEKNCRETHACRNEEKKVDRRFFCSFIMNKSVQFSTTVTKTLNIGKTEGERVWSSFFSVWNLFMCYLHVMNLLWDWRRRWRKADEWIKDINRHCIHSRGCCLLFNLSYFFFVRCVWLNWFVLYLFFLRNFKPLKMARIRHTVKKNTIWINKRLSIAFVHFVDAPFQMRLMLLFVAAISMKTTMTVNEYALTF